MSTGCPIQVANLLKDFLYQLLRLTNDYEP